MLSHTTTTTTTPETCKCCNGRGIQTRKDGIKIKCPNCDGKGTWYTSFTRGGSCSLFIYSIW